jgi:hypothetical protein
MAEPEDAELPERERAHLRQRDRKRVTRMVVDNAGVKRLQTVVRAKRPSRPAKPEAANGDPQP